MLPRPMKSDAFLPPFRPPRPRFSDCPCLTGRPSVGQDPVAAHEAVRYDRMLTESRDTVPEFGDARRLGGLHNPHTVGARGPMRGGTAVHLLPASLRQGGRNANGPARRRTGIAQSAHRRSTRPDARRDRGPPPAGLSPPRGEKREWPGATPDRNCTIRTPSEHEPDARRDRGPPPAGLSPPRGEEREWPGATPDRNCTIRTPSEHEPDARRDRGPPPAGLSPPRGRNANARRDAGPDLHNPHTVGPYETLQPKTQYLVVWYCIHQHIVCQGHYREGERMDMQPVRIIVE